MRGSRLAIAAAAILLPAAAGAQTVARDFSELARTVGAGDRVHVFDLAGREVVGPITDLTPDAIVIGSKRATIRLDRSQVVLVRKDRQDSIVNGILTGAAVGGGLGLLAGGTCSGFAFHECFGPVLAGSTAWGVGIGILSDLLHRTPRDVYRVGPRPVSMQVQPVAARDRGGVRVAVRW